MIDFEFCNHGSICLLRPLTSEAEEWIEAHLAGDFLEWGGAVVIEPRYVEPLLDGITEAGLNVKGVGS